MEHIFVTGISGLLGTNLVHLLLEKGYQVTGLVRKRSSYKGKTSELLTIVEGELFDDLLPILEKVDRVVHIAAITAQDLLHYDTYRRINCEATIQLFHSAQQAKVKQFVFISTANTVGNGSRVNPGYEGCEVKPPFSESFYARSKREAEARLLEGMDSIDLCILNPTFMIGAYDSKPSSGKLITMVLGKRIVFCPSGGKNFVAVEDVATAILHSFQHTMGGEKYVIGNENLSYKEFYKQVALEANENFRFVLLPKFLLVAVGYLGDLLRSCGVKTALSNTNMRILCEENYYDTSKSVTKLDIEYRPVREAIGKAVTYFSGNY